MRFHDGLRLCQTREIAERARKLRATGRHDTMILESDPASVSPTSHWQNVSVLRVGMHLQYEARACDRFSIRACDC